MKGGNMEISLFDRILFTATGSVFFAILIYNLVGLVRSFV